MDTEEYKFYLSHGSAALLYKLVIIGFLCFAAFFVYEQLGITSSSALIYAFILVCAGILVYPLINSRKPMYIIDGIGIRQKKYPFLPHELPWSDIKSISYPADTIFGGEDSVFLDVQSSPLITRPFVISLSDIDNPPAFLEALNNFKPFGYDQLRGHIYFQRHHDKERILYITFLYLCMGISVLLMATFDMPYVWLEDNRYSTFWAVLFFSHLLFSGVLSFFAYKDIEKRKTIVKAAILFWFFVTLGPFVVEQNAYYNAKALMAEKRGDYKSAEMYIRKAIQIHPEGYSYHETFGKILFQQGQFTECIDQFNFLLVADKRLTDYYKAYYHLWIGKALLKLDRVDTAKEEFRKVKEFNIDDFNKELDTLQ
jgi:hypothetical protein